MEFIFVLVVIYKLKTLINKIFNIFLTKRFTEKNDLR